MNILIINQDWFAEPLRAQGHTVLTCSVLKGHDVQITRVLPHINELLADECNGFTPDAVVVLDNSSPLPVVGIEELEIPTLFYSVDAQHHAEFHKYLTRMFDVTFCAQKDYIPELASQGRDVRWLPLWAPRYVEASDEKRYESCFIGNMNRELNSDRVDFFEALKEKVPIHLDVGKYWEYFPHSKIVVNQTVKGDLNFRVFEAMMCGAALLTEKSGNGLFDLFKDGKHLITYERSSVDDASTKINDLLAEPEKLNQVAKSGREEILRAHTEQSRAEQILKCLNELNSRPRLDLSSKGHFGSIVNLHQVIVRNFRSQPEITKRAFSLALQKLECALNLREALDEEMACHIISVCISFTDLLKADVGYKLLQNYADSYPDLGILQLACIRESLRGNDEATAKAIAKKHFPTNPEAELFPAAETLVSSLVSWMHNSAV